MNFLSIEHHVYCCTQTSPSPVSLLHQCPVLCPNLPNVTIISKQLRETGGGDKRSTEQKTESRKRDALKEKKSLKSLPANKCDINTNVFPIYSFASHIDRFSVHPLVNQ